MPAPGYHGSPQGMALAEIVDVGQAILVDDGVVQAVQHAQLFSALVVQAANDRFLHDEVLLPTVV